MIISGFRAIALAAIPQVCSTSAIRVHHWDENFLLSTIDRVSAETFIQVDDEFYRHSLDENGQLWAMCVEAGMGQDSLNGNLLRLREFFNESYVAEFAIFESLWIDLGRLCIPTFRVGHC
jgi:hypothetical protein